jgi:hypothetical protein
MWSLIRKEKKQLFSLRKLPGDFEVRGHCMCKEMPVIPVDRVVDKTRIIRKMEGQGGGEAQGVVDPKNRLISNGKLTTSVLNIS